jgi:GT2 family glycosyltransferase
VFPTYSTWLGGLQRTLQGIERVGLVSPIMKYPDGSLQYAGTELRLERNGFFLKRHPWRGLSRPEHQRAPFQIQASTTACALIRRALFERVGGLDDGFILGDYADSDLSLKVQELGYSVWCDPTVEVVRLEQQSPEANEPNLWARGLTHYNAWRHHTRWSARLLNMRHGDEQ